jgi:hypothetical protein
MNGNEIWYYNIISTDSPAEIIVEQHNDMPNSENLKLSDKYIELHFVGDEVVNCQTKGVDNYPRGNKLLRKVLIGAGLMVGGAMVFIIIVSIQFKRAGGFN